MLPTVVPLIDKENFPWHVHTTEPLLVVPLTVSSHAGVVAPLVPAVVTNCLFPDGSAIAAARA